MRCSNTVFYVYWSKISRNRGHFSSTAIVLDTLCKILLSTSAVLEKCPQLQDNFLK